MSLERTNIKRGWALITGATGAIAASDGGCISACSHDGAGLWTLTLSPEQSPNYTSVKVTPRTGTGITAKVKTYSAANAVVIEAYVASTATATDCDFDVEILTSRAN